MKSSHSMAMIAVTQKGKQQARLLRQRLRSGELYFPLRQPEHDKTQTMDGTSLETGHSWEHPCSGSLADLVPALFAQHDQLVFFLAIGAVTRLIAPCLVSKESDPGVLAIDEAGNFVIVLLSGHRGGANAFARTVAGCLGATPIVTTASDVIGGLSLDLLEETFGWSAEPKELLKEATMALVNREPVAIVQEIGTRGTWLDEMELPDHVTLINPADRIERPYAKILRVSERAPTSADAQDAEKTSINPARSDILWFRPKSLVLGVGCERGITLKGLEEGLHLFLEQEGYAQACIDTLASADVKADEPALAELARKQGWRTVFYAAADLAGVSGTATPSAVVERCIGTPGVAEPAALLAARSDSLLVAKQIIRVTSCTQAMTFALARHGQFQIRSATAGRVYFVGAGPGDPELLTLRASHLLRQAEVVIYAGSLIPEGILRQVPRTAALHNSAYLTLEQVMERMLSAVRAGRRVVRLHSGDTSLYSAIQEQIAVLEREMVEFEVVPGISAFQAVAAALKSELTLPEKVQTIILTRGEGLTPMPVQESLQALAQHQATLCIYLSALLAEKVQDQLLTAYPPETPVAIAHRISWPDEAVIVTRLDQLSHEMRRHEFRRTTLIVVGAAVGGRHHRSHLYDESHGHLFRKRARGPNDPAS